MNTTISNMTLLKANALLRTTTTPTLGMNTVKLFCKQKMLSDVMADMMKSNVKYWPVRRYSTFDPDTIKLGYMLEMDADHPIVSFLVLKFGLEQIE